jgi:hypothetical protein
MKTSIKLFALGMTLMGFGVNVNAQSPQVSQTALASARILIPIAMTKNVDLSFGNVIASASAGTVELTTAGVRTAALGATLHSMTGTVSVAKFTVTGSAGFTFAISVPTGVLLSNSDATPATMNVDIIKDFGLSETLDGDGNKILLVGGTLNVGANQAAGIYTNTADLKVTVNYN